jgi:hypothetical protein
MRKPKKAALSRRDMLILPSVAQLSLVDPGPFSPINTPVSTRDRTLSSITTGFLSAFDQVLLQGNKVFTVS